MKKVKCIAILLAFCLSAAFAPARAQQAAVATTAFTGLHYPYTVQHAALADSVDIAYMDIGKGKITLLFIHGLGSYAPVWQNNLSALQATYRCIAIDLPGYGQSSKPYSAIGMGFYADAVAALIRKLQLQRVVLVAHSMGGQVALHLALRHAALVSGLVLVAPAGIETFNEVQKAQFRLFANPGIFAAYTDDVIRQNLQKNFYAFPESANFMASDRIAMRGQAPFSRYCYSLAKGVTGMVDEPIADRLPQVKMPTLILFGANDQLIPNKFMNPQLTTEAVLNSGMKAIPNAMGKLVPEAGHMLQFEKPTVVNAAIDAFLLPLR